jgi:hypothetical protein
MPSLPSWASSSRWPSWPATRSSAASTPATVTSTLKLAPFGFALGIAVICCVATICAGRVLGAYAEQQRIKQVAALTRADARDNKDTDAETTDTEEQAA